MYDLYLHIGPWPPESSLSKSPYPASIHLFLGLPTCLLPPIAAYKIHSFPIWYMSSPLWSFKLNYYGDTWFIIISYSPHIILLDFSFKGVYGIFSVLCVKCPACNGFGAFYNFLHTYHCQIFSISAAKKCF